MSIQINLVSNLDDKIFVQASSEDSLNLCSLGFISPYPRVVLPTESITKISLSQFCRALTISLMSSETIVRVYQTYNQGQYEPEVACPIECR